jgi:hypothetical protein
MNERSGNVYENKGQAFSRPARSGNVIEKTGSYALTARMLLKIQVVGRLGKSRIQDSGFRRETSGDKRKSNAEL